MSLTIDIEMYVLNATLQKAEFLSETSHLKIFLEWALEFSCSAIMLLKVDHCSEQINCLHE